MANETLKEQGWSEKEVGIIEKFKGYGLAEALAIDCMLSRTSEETEAIFRFLDRYGDKMKIS